MMDSVLLIILLSGFRLALPIIFSSIGGYFSEKSGVAQIALEAFLLSGAFAAATVSFFTKSIALTYISAGLAAVLMAQLFCILVLTFRSNAIVIGTGLNLFVMGIIPLMSKSIFDSTGSTPALQMPVSDIFPPLLLLACFAIAFYISEKSLWGLQMKFAGERQEALLAVGVSPKIRQWQSISIGAFFCGLGGAILSTYLSSAYSPLMSAGRGYIALAALIFAGWSLPKAIFISFFFGLCEALQIQAQSNPLIAQNIAAEFIQMMPYLMTLIVLLFFRTRQQAPKELK